VPDGCSGNSDVSFARSTNHERWNGNELLADGDLSLADEDTSFVDGLGKGSLVHEGLESSLHEEGDSQSEHEIKFALLALKQTESHHTPDECLAFENSSWVLFIHGQKDSGGLSELGKHKLLAPNLSLATQTVKADQSQTKNERRLWRVQ